MRYGVDWNHIETMPRAEPAAVPPNNWRADMTTFTVYKTNRRIYTAHDGMYRGSRGYVTSRKDIDWVISADNGFKMNGYDRKRDAIAAGTRRGWTYKKA